MIKIDAVPQPSTGAPVRTNNDIPTSAFADFLAEQVDKVAVADKGKRPLVYDDYLTNSEESHKTNLRDELDRLLSMSPSELIRYQMLKQMGLNEEALKELPYEERVKIENKIQEKIEQQLGTKVSSEHTTAKIL